jgi:hypothetical protein
MIDKPEDLAITHEDCRMIGFLFGFLDSKEFEKFARRQQRKHIDRQLNRFAESIRW